MFLDADTHVDECEDTWTYMPEKMMEYKPVHFFIDPDNVPSFVSAYDARGWFIDGSVHRRGRPDDRTGTTAATRELLDVRARVDDMDRVGTGIQVIYSSLLLNEITTRPELMTALCQSYNRWLADRCSESGGRLQWIAALPYLDMQATVSELRWAKEHGAVGAYKRSIEVEGRVAGDHYFDPFYQAAVDLDIAVCIHTGLGWAPVNRHYTGLQSLPSHMLFSAFSSLVGSKVPTRFKGLRVGFVEAGSGWIPYALWQQRAADSRQGLPDPEKINRALGSHVGMLSELNFWVTCESSEDLPYLINDLGDDNLMVGSDYGHGDRASINDAHSRIVNYPGVSTSSAEKITRVNAEKFYGVTVPANALASAP